MWVLAIVAVVVVGGALVQALVLADERRRLRTLRADVQRAGLRYSESDPFGLWNRMPLDLIDHGEVRGIANVVWRDGDPNRLHVFDLWWHDMRTDRRTGRQVPVNHGAATCVAGEVGWLWPHLAVTREGIAAKALKGLGLDDIELESEEFNRRFLVRCRDRRFAFSFLDAQMIDFLNRTGGDVELELHGRWFVLVMRRLKGAEIVPFLRLGQAFLKTVPPAAHALYPEPDVRADVPVLPPPIRPSSPWS